VVLVVVLEELLFHLGDRDKYLEVLAVELGHRGLLVRPVDLVLISRLLVVAAEEVRFHLRLVVQQFLVIMPQQRGLVEQRVVVVVPSHFLRIVKPVVAVVDLARWVALE
jgi:predicted transcriptional regulator